LTFQDVIFENLGLILPGEAFAKKQGFMTSTILTQGALLIFCYAVAVSLLISVGAQSSNKKSASVLLKPNNYVFAPEKCSLRLKNNHFGQVSSLNKNT
jgi:hypothetical protein